MLESDIHRSESIRTGGTSPATTGPPRIRLGEELPVFCEGCGYPLHGAPQHRCERCELLHFHCPECGRRQPINTLRPAALRTLGRLRAWSLGLWIIIKLGLIVCPLMGLWAMSFELGYMFTYGRGTHIYIEIIIVTAMLATPYGMVARLMLLKWKRGWIVGAVLAGLALLAIVGGAVFFCLDRQAVDAVDQIILRVPMITLAMIFTLIGAIVAWPIWSALVRLLLPQRTATQLLDWQRQLSDGSAMAR